MKDMWRIHFVLLFSIPVSMAIAVGMRACGIFGAVHAFLLCWLFVGFLVALNSSVPSSKWTKYILLWGFALFSDTVKEYINK